MRDRWLGVPASIWVVAGPYATTQQTALTQVERFSRAVHESLDPVATAFVLSWLMLPLPLGRP